MLTVPQFIRTCTEVRPEWLLEYAPTYFDPKTFPENSAVRRALERVIAKVSPDASKRQ
jgi:pre-mRNA-splicing factor ATP-dependent RNA helicase DHX15/PRP43